MPGPKTTGMKNGTTKDTIRNINGQTITIRRTVNPGKTKNPGTETTAIQTITRSITGNTMETTRITNIPVTEGFTNGSIIVR
jgi:hypothetical protein